MIYRPIELLLSRTIADRRARGFEHDHPLRTPLILQVSFALGFLVLALALRGPIQDDLFDGSGTLYWILVVAVLAYAASYFARGWLAGHQWFGLYGGLVFLEATSRLAFAVAVAVGIAEGQSAVALGMAAAPFVSLVVVPWAFSRRPPGARSAQADADALGLGRGGRFALAVLAVMIAEQTLLNAAVLLVDVTSEDAAVAGFVFNVLLIARAPLQLFQAIQGSLLPHLAGLEAREGREEFARAIRVTILAIAGFAGAVALGLVLIGPFAMDLLFDDAFTYGRWGLALVALGMGAHLTAGTLNQAALARDRAGTAAGCWLVDRRRVRRVHGQPARRGRAAARGDRLLRRRGAAVRAAGGRLPRGGRAPSASSPGRHVGPALLDEHGLALDEVAHRDLAAPDPHEGAAAAVLGQPLRAADGRGAVPALGAEAALAVAPQPPDLLLLRRRARLPALLLVGQLSLPVARAA